MNNIIGDELTKTWPFRHHQTNPQENRMTRISEARAAIDHAAKQLAGINANPLAEAITDAGIGLSFTPTDISLIIAMIRAIEHGPGTQPAAPAPAPAQQQQQQQTSAQQLQPQQPA